MQPSARPRKILVAVDDSDYAPHVAEEAARMAAQKGVGVVILSVVLVSALASEGEIDDLSTTEEVKGLKELHQKLISKYFAAAGTPVESKVLYGDPADKICDYAEAIDAETIVVGSAGKGRLEAFLLGSVSEKVARHSRRSVMIVRKLASSSQPAGGRARPSSI